jgi:sarcosine oxidase
MNGADVVVAGLGAMGSSTLYHLARRGVTALGIDQFRPPHSMGSSHGDSRIIREAYYEHPLYVPMVRRAYQLWEELSAAAGEALYRKTGGLMMGPREGPLVTGSLQSAREHAVPHELYRADDIRKRWPGFSPPPDFVGLWEDRAGMLFPERAVAAQIRLAEQAGASVLGETTFLGWSREGNELVVSTGSGSIRTRHLVLSLGAWITRHLGPPFVVERQQFHWFAPVPQVGPLGPDRYPVVLCEHRPGGLFVTLPDNGKGVKIDIHHEGRLGVDPDTVSRVTTPEEEAEVRALLARFFPAANGRLNGSSVCLYTNTPDRHFVVDRHPDDPAILVLSPCSGHGFKFASVMGEIAADLVLTGRSRFDLAPFSLRRFRS